MGVDHARSHYPNHKEGDVEDTSNCTKIAILEVTVGSPPFEGKLMLVGPFGFTLLDT